MRLSRRHLGAVGKPDEPDGRRHRIRVRRQAESKVALETLDLWSGDQEFEEAMRLAIDEVVQAYAHKRKARIEAGRRMRTAEEIKTKVHPGLGHRASA